jgi:hypothetical protein
VDKIIPALNPLRSPFEDPNKPSLFGTFQTSAPIYGSLHSAQVQFLVIIVQVYTPSATIDGCLLKKNIGAHDNEEELRSLLQDICEMVDL